MPLNLDDKKAVVADIGAQVALAQTIVLAEYRGTPVGELTKLRAKLIKRCRKQQYSTYSYENSRP